MKQATLQLQSKAAPAILLIIVIVLFVIDSQQLQRLFRLDADAATLLREKRDLLVKQKHYSESQKIVTDRIAQLREYERFIPNADGYVWISKILHEAALKLPLTIDPPEISGQLISAPEYCTGLYRVRGTGSVDDLLVILKKIEEDLPFSRVQDLQIAFSKTPGAKVDFSFALLAVLRMNEDSEPVMTKASL